VNVVEFGPGIFGAEAAARHHYGIPAANLSRRQAAASPPSSPPRSGGRRSMGSYTEHHPAAG
jgi:monofunctional glycosyltransferase